MASESLRWLQSVWKRPEAGAWMQGGRSRLATGAAGESGKFTALRAGECTQETEKGSFLSSLSSRNYEWAKPLPLVNKAPRL